MEDKENEYWERCRQKKYLLRYLFEALAEELGIHILKQQEQSDLDLWVFALIILLHFANKT